MKRRSFFKFLGKGVVTGVVAATVGLPEISLEEENIGGYLVPEEYTEAFEKSATSAVKARYTFNVAQDGNLYIPGHFCTYPDTPTCSDIAKVGDDFTTIVVRYNKTEEPVTCRFNWEAI